MGCRSQIAVGKTLQLPLGFSRRAGSTKLHAGCYLCVYNDQYDVACASCRRAWVRSRRKGSRPVPADGAANAAYARQVLEAEGDSSWQQDWHGGWPRDDGGQEQEEEWQEEEWQGGEWQEEEWQEEEWREVEAQRDDTEGYEEEEEWEEGEEEKEWEEEEEWEEQEDAQPGDAQESDSSSSGAEEPPAKRARNESGP